MTRSLGPAVLSKNDLIAWIQWPVRRILRFLPTHPRSPHRHPRSPPQLALPLSSIGWAIAGSLKYFIPLFTTQQFVAQTFHIFPAAQLKKYVQSFVTIRCSHGFDGTKSQSIGDLAMSYASPHLPRLSCLRRMWLHRTYAALLMTN